MHIKAVICRQDRAEIRGVIMGAMPMTAVLTPEQVRAGLKLVDRRLIWFVLKALFGPRRGRSRGSV